MTDDVQGRRRKRKRLGLALSVLLGLLLGIFVPPLVSMSKYKARITQLMAESLGRPVRLSSVEFHLLPNPAFVLTDLTVAEDPAYGAEPVLHANTVKASIRLLSLWRGRLEIGTISVDEASFNVVRTAEGRWNLDSLFRTAAKAQPSGRGADQGSKPPLPLPYLEATNSRINFKRGNEKLPFSLVETDLSFWQEEPGKWRIRLRGQPARTDLSLDLADTGIVQLEAHIQRAPELRQMPLDLDVEWKEAQLGQLMKLVIGSDPGWRGDLTGNLHLDGTPDAAHIKTRLRAIGVHRAEFAPAAPMDFDASCDLLYHFSARSVENLACDSPLGDGRVHIEGGLPGNGGQPHLSIALDQIPVAAGLDALRTVRSNFGPGLQADGVISGKIIYAVVPPQPAEPARPAPSRLKRSRKSNVALLPAAPQPLTGSLSVDGFQLSGDALNTPIKAAKILLTPAPGDAAALVATVPIPAGAPTPLTVTARLSPSGYKLTLHGEASVARAREMIKVSGMADTSILDQVAGEPLAIDIGAEGPWMPSEPLPFSDSPQPLAVPAPAAPEEAASAAPAPPVRDTLNGTVTLHNANWKADFLANHVQISQAVLHLGQSQLQWDPILFSYGPVKGTAGLVVPTLCDPDKPCRPVFHVEFADLDASQLQAAILGAHEPGTLLSTLLARFRPSDASPAWPLLDGTVKANSLLLGPVTLHNVSASVRILAAGADIDHFDADLLGGQVHGGGAVNSPISNGKPSYTLEVSFDKLNPPDIGQLFDQHWTGRSLDASGKIDLSGFTDKDLATSASGAFHFDWTRGTITGSTTAGALPAPATHFDRWSGDASIADGKITLKDNQLQSGSRKQTLQGAVAFGNPAKLTLTLPKNKAEKP